MEHEILKKTAMKIILFSLLFFAGTLFFSCNSDTSENNVHKDTSESVVPAGVLLFTSPSGHTVIVRGKSIDAEISLPVKLTPDSVKFYFNGALIPTNGTALNVTLETSGAKAGTNIISARMWSGGQLFSANQNITVFSDKAPKNYSYKKLKSYNHSRNAYTQGFIYENGYIYEGTGQYGESALVKYRLETGEPEQSFNLPGDVFGEGIVISGSYIFQLTWQSHIAYKYDKTGFKLLNKFDFSTEGWGITNLGDNLVMSDGSYMLYVLSPESFNETGRIEVYDNIGPVNQLNELEIIDGLIYANVYQTDYIVIIDPATGFVTGKINLTGLLDKSKVTDKTDVLNGIAWDKENKRIFVTGKYWPEIYEIEIVGN